MEMTLDMIRPGMRAMVTDIRVERHLRRRLRDFGLIPGTVVCCRFWSPGEHVLALELRGSVIAVRRQDARLIRIRMEE